MKIYDDDEIRRMAGHPDCVDIYEVNGFLRGFRKAQELLLFKNEFLDNSRNQYLDNSRNQYSKNGLPFMYPHLEEDKIFNDNFDEIEKYAKECQINQYGDFGKPKSNNYPEFRFQYKGIIHPTHYDFTFKNALFRYCWVEPFEEYRMGNQVDIFYRTGSYYVIFDYEKEGYDDYKLK
jgi:hypothetical protein